ncbi:hypothetical protein AJ80_01986 [Polytolypa hystricis UAMH7299]|uniref:Uncharacterized protein n=1 Tax=Polytolypa hystricis (strain UAMH7299) TaxID=1447883 RepID=A0A2B7YIL4_POLH7|nr:hypothetical protein AJ80_01986 [Polytolypa hystricis UAMH7299]
MSSPSRPPVYPPPHGSMQDSVAQGQKQQRGEEFRFSKCAKKLRLLSETCHSQKQSPSKSLWDRLSKVWLTRRALEELNQRTAEQPSRSQIYQPKERLNKVEDWSRLQRFARHGGPDLCDLRGYPEPADLSRPPLDMAATRSSSSSRRSRPTSVPNRLIDTPTQRPTTTTTTTTTTERKTSAYDANFEQILIDHGTYPAFYKHPDGHVPPLPRNWDELRQRIARTRTSLSPHFSETDLQDFQHLNASALGEKKVMSSVFPTIRGDADIPFEEDKLFGNLVPFADGIVDAKPDFYDGARAGQLEHQVRSDLSGYIIPSTQHDAPILPNFFVEGKGPNGSSAVSARQALYDGTLGARAMLRLQCYGKERIYDGNAYTITATYHPMGLLVLYTTHPTESTSHGRDTDFHRAQLGAWALRGSLEQFREGVSALRNARDWAKEQRDKFIAAANNTVADMHVDMSSKTSNQTTLPSRSARVSHDSETSADELAPVEVTRIHRSIRKRALSESGRRDSDSRSKLSRTSRRDRYSQKN